jgi:hypothetical protein
MAKPRPIAATPRMNKDQIDAVKYINLISKFAVQAARETGIPASLIVAQAGLENRWGKRDHLTKSAKNFHGIKGKGPAGSVFITTHEQIGGELQKVEGEEFAAFDDTLQAFRRHASILATKPAYRKAREYIYDPILMGHALTGIYATDAYSPNDPMTYGDKLENIIRLYRLQELDEPHIGPPPQEVTDNYWPGLEDSIRKPPEGEPVVDAEKIKVKSEELPPAPPPTPAERHKNLVEELDRFRSAATHGAAGRALQKVTGKSGAALGGEMFLRAVTNSKVAL